MQPPPKKLSNEIVVADRNDPPPPPEPKEPVAKEIPSQPCTSEDVAPFPKQDDVNSSKSPPEEGEIHQSESAREENAEASKDSDPLMTEESDEQKEMHQASPSRDILEKGNEEKAAEQSAQGKDNEAQVPKNNENEKEKALVPPSDENDLLKENREKAKVPLKENAAMEIDRPSTLKPDGNAGPSESVDPSQSRPQISERIAGLLVYADVSMTVEEEMALPKPRECLPIFSEGEGAKGPLFNEEIHRAKLAFFGMSPYEGEQTSPSPRFWMHEQAVFYSWILYKSNRIFQHEYLDVPLMRNLECFRQVLQELDDFQSLKVLSFKHPWNQECILQFYATLYVTADRFDINPGCLNG